MLTAFPLQLADWKRGRVTIPWSLIAPHEAQALKNHGQSLNRLAERHGLSPSEALAVIEDRAWRHVPEAEALAALDQHIAKDTDR